MIELLIGPIACGKSTYALKQAQKGALIVNDDAIVNAIHCINTLYSPELKPLYKLIEYQIIHFGVLNNKHVVIDRPNLSINTRRRYTEIAHSLDAQITGIVFPIATEAEHVQRRFENDNRGYSYDKWVSVYRKHMATYIPPTLEEGLDFIWLL